MTLNRDEEIHVVQMRSLRQSQVQAVREMVLVFLRNNSQDYGENVVNIWLEAVRRRRPPSNS